MGCCLCLCVRVSGCVSVCPSLCVCVAQALTCSSCTWTHGRAPGTARLPHSQAPRPAQTSPSPGLGEDSPVAPETEHDLLCPPRTRARAPALRGGPCLTLHTCQPRVRGVPDTWSTELSGGGRTEAASPSPTPGFSVSFPVWTFWAESRAKHRARFDRGQGHPGMPCPSPPLHRSRAELVLPISLSK